jgi:hypothetical protein
VGALRKEGDPSLAEESLRAPTASRFSDLGVGKARKGAGEGRSFSGGGQEEHLRGPKPQESQGSIRMGE